MKATLKTIGIIGAMNEEIESIKKNLEIISAKNIVGSDYFMGKLYGTNIVLVRCGIGKVNAAICTQVLIDLYGVDCVINTGVAGAIQKDLEIGDVIISKDLVYHDLDARGFGYSLGEIPRLETSNFKSDINLIELAKNSCENILTKNKFYIERIASGDQFISSSLLKENIWSNFKAYCVDMESTAIGHTCYLNKIPFLIIRAISDKSDDKAGNTYNNSLEIAVKNSSEITEDIIKNLN